METLNWSELGFGYIKTDYNIRCYYRDGKWGELEVSSSEIINIHMAATCLHYGQEAFEGLKAFRGKDGKVRVFRMDEEISAGRGQGRAVSTFVSKSGKMEEEQPKRAGPAQACAERAPSCLWETRTCRTIWNGRTT